MTNQPSLHKVGELRPSQMIFSFGIGSLINLPYISVIVLGIDDWQVDERYQISENRLLAAVKNQLGNQVNRLYIPPVGEDNTFGNTSTMTSTGVPVVPFPGWGKCTRCNLLAPLEGSGVFEIQYDRYRFEKTRYVHTNCSKTTIPPPVLPVRFMIACRNGHLDDFPWADYVHRGVNNCNPAVLRMSEKGPSGAAADIWIRCDTCGESRPMSEAFGEGALEDLLGCRGCQPHLRNLASEDCEENVRTILLSASNSWFPLMLTALSIPRSIDRLKQLIDDNWALLARATTLDRIQFSRERNELSAFAEFSDEQLLEAVEEKRSEMSGEVDDTADDLKLPEWEVLTAANPNLISDDFKLKEVDPPAGYESLFVKTVLAERLRQVCALIGFTRVDSPGDFSDLGEIDEERRAPISRQSPEWVPAAEVRGEGIFIQFNEEVIQQWCDNEHVQQRATEMFQAHRNWRRRRGITPTDAEFPGIRYVLIHSFSHAIMRQLALECGYTSASIRERIYSRNPEEPSGPMAGVLIYTGAPDSEGTLGGLVRMGDPQILGNHIDQALEEMKLCASDPFCAEASSVNDGIALHLAACHACLFAPETSCERGNKYLDRACLVTTFDSNVPAFFE